MKKRERPIILIPVYNPNGRLLLLVEELVVEGFEVVVVNDGSKKEFEVIFNKIARLAKVWSHEVNQGKGAALKTGFRHIGRQDVVTADGDGQHSVEDIKRVAMALMEGEGKWVMGTRRFGKGVPFRSAFGNFWTAIVFFLVTGVRIGDTQSGLRGIPAELIEAVQELPGNRYEYEMEMLVGLCRCGKRPIEVPIGTVYIDGNKSSHFRPLQDAVKIVRAILLSRSCRGR